MGNFLSGFCGKIAINLRTSLWTTCDHTSTPIAKKITNSQQSAENHSLSHCLYPYISNQLSPTGITKSPLMNTIYTQFPQHLLLQPLKKN